MQTVVAANDHEGIGAMKSDIDNMIGPLSQIAIAFAATIWLVSPAAAVNGGDFLKLDPSFASGYAFGILEVQLGLHDPVNTQLQMRQRDCFLNGGITSDVLFDAVARHIEANPPSLLEPAFVAVLRTMTDMCPSAE